MFHTKTAEKIKTDILGSVAFFKKNRAIYEIFCKNAAESGRPQMTKQYGACAMNVG
jgi:hypothetical protein